MLHTYLEATLAQDSAPSMLCAGSPNPPSLQSLIDSFSKIILGASYVPGTVMDVRDAAVNQEPRPTWMLLPLGVSTQGLTGKVWPVTCFGRYSFNRT